ncbi:lysine-2,3-aminomutase-like protein [Salinarimonas soli]|uniref:Lysine-2,3-aminomutase-like protein n=1 Tax=Salinarimonas soli TaxID=1638099 RepID=A0A5B2VQ64_9HYPH|nr:lysine-2,3-aminomutase-like protein [Salinarimonas soli]KAA2241185.1 lysine-2,3-aminomutase-like protein [Salinarimonas soli]
MTGQSLKDAADLVAAGLAAPERLTALERVAARYAVSITPDMAELIDTGDPADPIARQFVPDETELETTPEELIDPIGDEAHSPLPGIVHRYPDRVLLKPTLLCPVYCRFCFRREAVGPGKDAMLTEEALDRALAYIAEHAEVWEVILTGGDPLILSPRRLARMMTALGVISHLKVIRLHTRVPVVEPHRVTDELAAVLRTVGKATYVALHANHPRELTPAAAAACARLIDAGIPMLSQTVLLRGVNDDPDTLAALMRAFVEHRIKPYYLHHGDLAPGTGRFRTSIGEGQALMRTLRGRVSGLCQPTYVLDIPGGHGKVPVGPAYLGSDIVDDWRGGRHAYPPGDGA